MSYTKTRAVRDARRARAEAVQQTNANRTPEERLARLDAAGLKATKERAKLAKLISAKK